MDPEVVLLWAYDVTDWFAAEGRAKFSVCRLEPRDVFRWFAFRLRRPSMPRGHGFRNWRFGVVLLIFCGSAGCSFQVALIDGFFGGISDTMATIISKVLLGAN